MNPVWPKAWIANVLRPEGLITTPKADIEAAAAGVKNGGRSSCKQEVFGFLDDFSIARFPVRLKLDPVAHPAPKAVHSWMVTRHAS
ncbi:MAG: hypothetical protein V3U43_07045 [Pseudomonadales bacterium]